jgi:hypothetical protein
MSGRLLSAYIRLVLIFASSQTILIPGDEGNSSKTNTLHLRFCVGICTTISSIENFVSIPVCISISISIQVNGPREAGRYNLSVALLGDGMMQDWRMNMGESQVQAR